MEDKISFTMKIMLLMTIKTARLHTPGGMKHHGWRVPVGFCTPSDYKGVGKPTRKRAANHVFASFILYSL
jgi:hypothetical protein